jgi:hypothetical protein
MVNRCGSSKRFEEIIREDMQEEFLIYYSRLKMKIERLPRQIPPSFVNGGIKPVQYCTNYCTPSRLPARAYFFHKLKTAQVLFP